MRRRIEDVTPELVSARTQMEKIKADKDAASLVHSKLWWVKWKQSIVTNFMLDLQEVGIS